LVQQLAQIIEVMHKNQNIIWYLALKTFAANMHFDVGSILNFKNTPSLRGVRPRQSPTAHVIFIQSISVDWWDCRVAGAPRNDVQLLWTQKELSLQGTTVAISNSSRNLDTKYLGRLMRGSALWTCSQAPAWEYIEALNA